MQFKVGKKLFRGFIYFISRWQQNLIGVMMLDIEYQEEDEPLKEVNYVDYKLKSKTSFD